MRTSSGLLPLLTCICWGHTWLSAAAAANVQFAMFTRCPDGQVHNGTTLFTAWEVSFLKCASSCSLHPECNSLNVCPTAKDGVVTSVQCTMFLDIAGEDCQGLRPDARSSEEHCFYPGSECEGSMVMSATLSLRCHLAARATRFVPDGGLGRGSHFRFVLLGA